jgi:hypothetical protein
MRRALCFVALAAATPACLVVTDFDGYAMPSGGSGPATGGHAGSGGDGGAGGTCAGIDFSSDPGHCGACGHDCLGGDCAAGKCQPVLLAEGGDDETFAHLLVHDGAVYWSVVGPQEIRSIPVEGGDVATLASLAVEPDFLAAEGGTLLVSSTKGQTIYRIDIGTRATEMLCVELAPVVGVAVDAGTVYYHRYEANGDVRTVPIGGGTVGTVASRQFSGFGIAAAAGSVYWSTLGSGGPDGTLAMFGTNTVAVLANAERKPSGIALDATYVYWVDAYAHVRRAEREPPNTVDEIFPGYPEAEGEKGFSQLVRVDATHAWTSLRHLRGDFGLLRVPKDGGTEELVVPDVEIYGLGDDADAVYYTTQPGMNASTPARLWKIAK